MRVSFLLSVVMAAATACADVAWETAAIQAKIDAAAAAGGGRVTVVKGVHPCGTLHLKSGVELHLEEGAVLRGGDKSADYEDIEVEDGIYPEKSKKVFICAEDAHDIAITGKGVIDGQGPKFFDQNTVLWEHWWEKPKWPRPRMVQFMRCRNVRLEGVTFKDSPNWTMWLRFCENITVKGIRIDAEQKIINSDGIDFDACKHMRVSDSYFKTGDDCLILRAKRGNRTEPVVCEDAVFENCELHSTCQGVRIGCPSDDFIRDAVIRNMRFEGRNAVVSQQPYGYLTPGDRGYMKTANILFENWTCECVGHPVQIYVDGGIALRDFGHMTFRNFEVKAKLPFKIRGCAETVVRDIRFENIRGTIEAAEPFDVRAVEGLKIDRFEVTSGKGEATPFKGAKGSSWETVAPVGAVGLAGEIKLGIVGIDTSHAIEFTKHINVEKDREIFKDFRIVAAYKYGSKSIHSSTNRYPKYEAELKGMGVEMVPSVKDVLAKCDAVLLETNDGREHLRQAREIFASGKPVFIDKPIAHNYADALQILREAKARKAKFFSCSGLRWTEKVQAARRGDFGRVIGVNSFTPTTRERTHSAFMWYGVHGFEPLCTVMGLGAEAVSCMTTKTNDVVTVRWKDGRIGVVRGMSDGPGRGYGSMAFTEKGPVNLCGYAPMLEEILKFFKTGVVPYPPEETEEIFCIMAAAELSGKQGGRIVKLDEIREKAASAQRAPGDVRARDLTPLKDFKPGKGPSAIVARGRFPQMTIVAEGSCEGRFAAPFLAATIEEMTGAKLKVVYENPAKPVTNAPAIYIGDTEATRRAGLVADAREEWGPEAHRFRVVVKDGSIYLCGNRCDYAVVDFAERVLGVRQYWPAKEDGRAVVKTEGLAVPPMEYSDAPVFAHRDLWPYEGADWCRVWKVGNSHRGCHHVHAPARWHVDTNLNYKATRPEIFALTDDGKRATMPLLCYGNPRTLETYKERILAEIASGSPRGDITDPRSKTITVSQWDIQVFCNCEYCQAILKKNPKASEESVPSFSNVLWGYFTKELAKWAKKELPGWKISILPYHNTTAIPDGVDFIEEGNVETYLCTMPGLAMLKDASVKQREEKLIRDWARITGRPVQNWHYIIWPAETCPLPYLFGKTIQRHYRDTGDVTVGSFLNGRYPVDRLVLSAYCWLRLLWNPETNVDAIYDTFATRMFGPASRQMREIVRMQEAGWERPWKTPRLNNRNFYEVSFPRADVQKIEALFAEAEKLAADNAVVTNRIAWYKKGFRQMFAESAEYAAGCAFAPLLMQKVAQDPVIDGKLDEPCWKTAEPQEFCEFHKEGSQPQKEGTSLRAVWTPKGVTFGVDCRERDMANLCDDGPTGNYWANDSVECLVDLGGEYGAFGRVMVNASGKCEWYDGFLKAQEPEGVKCVVAKNGKSWSFELYVPYAALFKVYKDFEHPTTSGGMNWSGNFIRLHRGDKLSTPVGKRGPKGTEITRLHTRGKLRNSDPAAFTKFIFREN